PFYAMKMVTGRSLAELMKEVTSLDDRLALLPHVIAVADAIAYTHEQNVIHRDLKPLNILIGAFGETVVVDWGLAADLSQADRRMGVAGPYEVATSGLTVAGTVLGTPEYMPPEQAAGKSVDKRADVYAIGAILYHLLAGSPPYEGNTSKEILAKVLTDEPVSLETRVSGVPRDLATIVRKAMSRDCNARYPTAKELSSDLKSFQTGQLVSAYHYTTFALFRRWFRKYRLPVSLCESFLLLLGALSIASIRSIVRARNNAEAQRIAAVRERILAETRGDQLLLSAASSALGRDPTEALAWLKLYPRVDKNEERVRDIAADAVSRGVARHVLSHDQAVTTAHFSPDSKYLVSASAIGPVRIWSTETGKKIAELHTARSVYAARFTPDGTTVAFAGADNAITLWKWQTNQTQQLNGHQGSVRHLAFSNGGRLVSCAWDNTVRLWDPATGSSQVLAVHSGAVSSLSVSHDGNIVASAGVTASLSIK